MRGTAREPAGAFETGTGRPTGSRYARTPIRFEPGRYRLSGRDAGPAYRLESALSSIIGSVLLSHPRLVEEYNEFPSRPPDPALIGAGVAENGGKRVQLYRDCEALGLTFRPRAV